MIKFISFGSGSSGNCYYLSYGETSILIDAGIGIKTLKRYFKIKDLSLDNIDAVFVTHDHADHIKAVGNLANDVGLMIYATEGVVEGMNRSYCMTRRLTAEQVRFVSKDVSLQLGDMVVTPFSVPHDSTDCVGYRVQCGDTVFCLITDVGHVTPDIERAVSDAHYLVLEANHDENMLDMGPYPAYLKGRIRGDRGHLCNKSCGMLLATHVTPRMRHVWLCHLSNENNHPVLAQKTVESVLREHGIVPGVDFALETLKRREPSCVYELE